MMYIQFPIINDHRLADQLLNYREAMGTVYRASDEDIMWTTWGECGRLGEARLSSKDLTDEAVTIVEDV
ncbi:MAG TPA: hypothetical protein VGN34_28345 [Ktedonobacteraceae bacterium]|jgi:hypothetical protein